MYDLINLRAIIIRIGDSTDESPHWTEKALEGYFINLIKTE